MVEYQVHVGGSDAYKFYDLIKKAAIAVQLEEKSLGVFVTHRHHLPSDQHFTQLVLSMQRLGEYIITGQPERTGDGFDPYDMLDGADITYSFVRTTETNNVTKLVMER